ncbi:MAG: hypothetical protein FWG65_10815 [Turicibacter sp.]|nr:hypothetical protein [Turicibacter sp.]
MKATFTLDKDNHRFIFEADDFKLEIAISPKVAKLNRIVHWDNGVIGYVIDDNNEEYEDLNEILKEMQMTWDFSKYELEVLK